MLGSRNLIREPWPYNPQNSRIDIRNPNKGPRFLNQVPTLDHVPFPGKELKPALCRDCVGRVGLLSFRLQEARSTARKLVSSLAT